MNEHVLEYNSGQIIASLKNNKRVLVDDVSFRIRAGETLSIVGETGSGKTMTALSIMKLLPANVEMLGGSIVFMGRELPNEKKMPDILGNEIVYIPQNGLEALNPSRRIDKHLYDNLEKIGVPKPEREKTAKDKLSAVGFAHPEQVMDKYPFQLSGGMAQRVTIAISACSNAHLVIADEPTNGLDQSSKSLFMATLRSLFPMAAKLIITHDISIAEMCDQSLVLCGGRMMERGFSSQVLGNPHHPYTKALLSSLVKNGLHESPFLRNEKGFCMFYRRCPFATESCLTAMEHRTEDESDWWCNNE